MAKSTLPPQVLEYFRKQGARGGKKGGSLGGRTAAERMTAAERRERASRAGKAAAKARQKHARPR